MDIPKNPDETSLNIGARSRFVLGCVTALKRLSQILPIGRNIDQGDSTITPAHVEPDTQLPNERYGVDKLIQAPNLRRSQNIARDEFGNRVFLSTDLGYIDNLDKEARSTLLISREGEEFIKENRGILNDLSGMLKFLEENQHENMVELKSKGRKLEKLKSGENSLAHILHINDNKYVVRVPLNDIKIKEHPYTHEMLQVQILDREFGSRLSNAGIALATFLCASPVLSITNYEEGWHPGYYDIIRYTDEQYELLTEAAQFIADKRKSGDPLFKGLMPGWWSGKGHEEIANHNFVRRDSDGIWVCIDPVEVNPYMAEGI
jgi:hypothetical protein